MNCEECSYFAMMSLFRAILSTLCMGPCDNDNAILTEAVAVAI